MKNRLNLQPDPRILIAITHNPMRPIDALCELVDNAIDAFADANVSDNPVDSPTVQITIPGAAEINRGQGSITVLDNGPGLSVDQAERALTAGFTSNNPYDRLGLFGMGFNISTGKLGKQTVVRTSRAHDEFMIEATINLEAMVAEKSYEVPFEELPNNPVNFQGTLVKVSEWWPPGHQNHGFALKLARLGARSVREELGRRYYPIIRENKVRIFVNDELCEPYSHCVWDENRAIKHREHGIIPAQLKFNEVTRTDVRCLDCNALVESAICSNCGHGNALRSIDWRIRGFIGIQRFDDANDFGIDLIRRGRVIKKLEKDAFFSWTPELGPEVKDYPIDSTYGRIVGEVHLDHVPTDFLKQDFQRTSTEWIDAISFLRGDSSLQPRSSETAGEPSNASPIYRIYQGYRRVRDFGSRDMYMGFWELGESRAKRISREVEKEYFQRFRQGEPGFFDDSEWWKLVEQADSKPVDDVIECPECGFQGLEGAESCPGCNFVFHGKTCLNPDCAVTLPISDSNCASCGTSQEVKLQDRWKCSFCSRMNPPSSVTCISCSRGFGEVNPLSYEFLKENSNRLDDLSIEAFSLPLPGGVQSGSFEVRVYAIHGNVSLQREDTALPAITFRDEGLTIFIDKFHPLFTEYQQHPEISVSMEIGKYLQEANARHMTGDNAHLWSLPSLCWQISKTHWQESLSVDTDQTRTRAEDFFNRMRESLSRILHEERSEIYSEMTPARQSLLALTLVQNGYDLAQLQEFIETGRYFEFIDNRSITDFVKKYPSRFFDGSFWSNSYDKNMPSMEPDDLAQIQNLILGRYVNYLEDILGFLESQQNQRDVDVTVRANQTLQLLTRQLAMESVLK